MEFIRQVQTKHKTFKACYFILPILLSEISSQINTEGFQGLTIYWN